MYFNFYARSVLIKAGIEEHVRTTVAAIGDPNGNGRGVIVIPKRIRTLSGYSSSV